jgi:hypothetical protein
MEKKMTKEYDPKRDGPKVSALPAKPGRPMPMKPGRPMPMKPGLPAGMVNKPAMNKPSSASDAKKAAIAEMMKKRNG